MGSCPGTSHLQVSFSKAPFWSLSWHTQYTVHISSMERYRCAVACLVSVPAVLGAKCALLGAGGCWAASQKDRVSLLIFVAQQILASGEMPCMELTASRYSFRNPSCLSKSRWDKGPSWLHASSHIAGKIQKSPTESSSLGNLPHQSRSWEDCIVFSFCM